MAAVASSAQSNGSLHATNGTVSSAVNGTEITDNEYSIVQETERLFKHGVLQNPKIQKNLPTGYEKFAAPISFQGSQLPSIPINWRFAESVSALKALEGTFVNALLVKKYGVAPQRIVIDTDHAQLFFMSAMHFWFNDGTEHDYSSFTNPEKKEAMLKYFPNYELGPYDGPYQCPTNIYKTKDRRFFHLHGSLDPAPTVNSVGLPPQPEKKPTSLDEALKPFMEAVAKIDSDEMQRLASDVYKQAGTICWTTEEFKNSEHGKANEHIALYDVHDGPQNPAQQPCWWPSSPQTGPERPLAGLKVVDITRIIAAPAVTRGLAELGASIMRVTAPHLPDLSRLHPDMNWGKWNCSLDFRKEEDREALKELILDADVVVSGYRPGVMEKWGFSVEDIFELCKSRERGIIVARENCYGWNGPWSYRSGWQQISDANTGVSMEFGRAMGNEEAVTPVFPNSDFCTGIAGICGIMDAILRRGSQGGSYRVDLALNYYSQWLVDSVGTYPKNVWSSVWSRNGNRIVRYYHNMHYTLPMFFKMLKEPGAPGNIVFNPDHFEDRECPNLTEINGGKKVTMRTNKPILRFPDGLVKPGYHVATRGNGVDAAKWPKDLTTQRVV